jgi:hypothetical protein
LEKFTISDIPRLTIIRAVNTAMRQYFKDRTEIFRLAFVTGGSVGVVWFVYRATETWNYFDVGCFHRFVLYVCIFTSLLPTLVFYLFLYELNRLLISGWGRDELRARKSEILTTLIKACISGGDVEKNERDLLDELAWSKLKLYWRDR